MVQNRILPRAVSNLSNTYIFYINLKLGHGSKDFYKI